MCIENSDLHNFADDNKISCVSSSLNELISELEKEGNTTTQWFRDSSMIVNPKKYQAIIIDRKNKKIILKSLQQIKKSYNSSENVALLGVEVDSKLKLMNIYPNYVIKVQGN